MPRCRSCRRWRSTRDEVIAFLRDLARRAKPFAQRDFAELAAFAQRELALPVLEPWDIAYASEKLKASRYAYNEQEVRQYLPEDRVLAGLFRVVETIYGLAIRESKAEVWHPDVRFFTIRDASGALVGEFYFDLYARANKQGGAWMDDAINRRSLHGKVQHPVAFLTCNLSAPVDGRTATFTHQEVITIFHEFGHGLHQLLTKVDIPGISGLQGVEWDAVELPSQFMENFCWEWDVLLHMTRHVDTGEPLPRALFDRMLAARNFESGMATVRQIEMGLFDMRAHVEYESREGAAAQAPQAILADVRREVAVVPARAVRPLPRVLLARFRRWIRGGLLQLQVGRGAVGGRVQPVRGAGRALARRRRAVPGRGARPRRQPPRPRVVRRLPRPATPTRCAPAA